MSLDEPACGVTRASEPALAFRAFSPRKECGVQSKPVKAPTDPRPSWASYSSLGFSLLAPQERLRAPSVHDLDRDEPTAAGPRRFAGAKHGLPGTRPPTRTRFLA